MFKDLFRQYTYISKSKQQPAQLTIDNKYKKKKAIYNSRDVFYQES